MLPLEALQLMVLESVGLLLQPAALYRVRNKPAQWGMFFMCTCSANAHFLLSTPANINPHNVFPGSLDTYLHKHVIVLFLFNTASFVMLV